MLLNPPIGELERSLAHLHPRYTQEPEANAHQRQRQRRPDNQQEGAQQHPPSKWVGDHANVMQLTVV